MKYTKDNIIGVRFKVEEGEEKAIFTVTEVKYGKVFYRDDTSREHHDNIKNTLYRMNERGLVIKPEIINNYEIY